MAKKKITYPHQIIIDFVHSIDDHRFVHEPSSIDPLKFWDNEEQVYFKLSADLVKISDVVVALMEREKKIGIAIGVNNEKFRIGKFIKELISDQL